MLWIFISTHVVQNVLEKCFNNLTYGHGHMMLQNTKYGMIEELYGWDLRLTIIESKT